VPKLSADRFFAPDIAEARELVVSGELRKLVRPNLLAQ
jgi:hypothetical protein